MILDVCDGLAARFEPQLDAEQRVVLDIEPLTWQKDHLYVYPMRVDEEIFETGPTRMQRFILNAVYVTDNEGEEAQLERSPELAAFLDGKRGTYMGVVRAATPAQGLWEYLSATFDDTRPRTLDKRSAAVRISGWRIV